MQSDESSSLLFSVDRVETRGWRVDPGDAGSSSASTRASWTRINPAAPGSCRLLARRSTRNKLPPRCANRVRPTPWAPNRLGGERHLLAGAMNGLNVIVWTGRVGANAPTIRAAATGGSGFLGIPIDDDRNQTATGDLDLTARGSLVRTLVVTAREDLESCAGSAG